MLNKKMKRLWRTRGRHVPSDVPVLLLVLLTLSVGCRDDGPTDIDTGPLWELAECDMTLAYLQDGGTGLDGIRALSDPGFLDAGSVANSAYVEDGDRVIGIVVDGQPLAVPLGALWYHEIVNLQRGGTAVAVTHSVLSGSSRVLNRSTVGEASFGTSGFLYKNNTLAYDRNTDPSLWDQMRGIAVCGPRKGSTLAAHPALEVTWGGWKSLYPNTLVLSAAESGGLSWGSYPYGGYRENPGFYFPETMPTLDSRRPAKERVLGIPGTGEGGMAFSFGDLEGAGTVSVAHGSVGGENVVVFWRSDLEGAAAYWSEAGGQALTFSVQDGGFVDDQTGTTWSFLGRGTGGGLDGSSLTPVSESVISYWGAWAAFFPDTELWQGG